MAPGVVGAGSFVVVFRAFVGGQPPEGAKGVRRGGL